LENKKLTDLANFARTCPDELAAHFLAVIAQKIVVVLTIKDSHSVK
jgi:hypothetical protein